MVTVRAMPLHKQHHLPVGQVTCLPLLRRNQRGAGFSVLAECLLPVVQAARPCPADSRVVHFIPGGGLHGSGCQQQGEQQDLMRDMSALLLPFHHGLLPGSSASRSSRLTRAIHASSTWLRRTAQGWPQSTPPEKKPSWFAVNKTGDDMKPDTQGKYPHPVISSRGKENLRLLIMLNSVIIYMRVFMSVIFAFV